MLKEHYLERGSMQTSNVCLNMAMKVSMPYSNHLTMSVVICIAKETVILGPHILPLKERSVVTTSGVAVDGV